ncbi:3-oxoacyl-[acyl-carrier-protein] reductase [Vagococcus sp. PNs007]|uniref:3-oxoacyl-[acyl-carrier-protein] reductase n=1 Tax=Vagococcus proximus TaxID=2991417 RepID=A0ABT5X1Z6_9ENTE|nr:3-oxoacyl-[acyl-carrier-protein] reductase [Vagococcus proximus]MDF0480021.1 3-oxoacyl-[acyl-carrier-protein] reductase [Vagococcus proximus]
MSKNKVVIVTGSTRGIGKALAEAFLKEGHSVVINGRGKEAPEWLADYQETSYYISGNVSKLEEAMSVINKTVEHFGRLDVLINNAGITRDTLLMRMTEEDFEEVLSINLTGTFNTIKASNKIFLKQRNGHIINIASVVGQLGNAGQANYAASKAGVIGLTKSVARELASRNIYCNAIAPGFISTEMTDVLTQDQQEHAKTQIPLKTFGTVEDVAQAALYLANQTYVTGQVLNVDGGMVMNG